MGNASPQRRGQFKEGARYRKRKIKLRDLLKGIKPGQRHGQIYKDEMGRRDAS